MMRNPYATAGLTLLIAIGALLVFGDVAWSQVPAAPAVPPAPPPPPVPLVAISPTWLVYTVIIVVLIASLVGMRMIQAAVARSNWSLADALSEEVEITWMVKNAAGDMEPKLENGKPVTISVLRASSSRLIAMMGTMAILFLFLGFGVFSLYHFGLYGSMPEDIGEAINFLLAGLTLFAPYVVNKFSSIFTNLTPKP
jgi:hypothetical protein